MPILPATAWPALVMPLEAVDAWEGTQTPSGGRVLEPPPGFDAHASVTDFDLACFAFDAPIPVGQGHHAFAVPSNAGAPMPFELVVFGEDFIVLVGYALDLEDGLGARVEDYSATRCGTLDLRASGQLAIFDPALTGVEARASEGRFAVHTLPPALYSVRLHDDVERYQFLIIDRVP